MRDAQPVKPSAQPPAQPPAQGCAQPWSWRRLGRIVTGVVGAAAALLVVGGVLLSYSPPFYRAAVAGGAPADGELLARRAVTKAAALHAAISRPGSWETAVAANELNAWLAIDLPRNHARSLPRWFSEPRLLLKPQHATCGARVGYGPFSAVATADFEIVLRNVNQLSIVLEQARLGAIPLPRAAILGELARRFDRLGMVTDIRRLDGRMVLTVYIPSTHDAGATSYWLESLTLSDGELLCTGTTRTAAEPRAADTAPIP